MHKVASRTEYRPIMAALVAQSASHPPGCTEISLLVEASDAWGPLFDTTALHAQRR